MITKFVRFPLSIDGVKWDGTNQSIDDIVRIYRQGFPKDSLGLEVVRAGDDIILEFKDIGEPAGASMTVRLNEFVMVDERGTISVVKEDQIGEDYITRSMAEGAKPMSALELAGLYLQGDTMMKEREKAGAAAPVLLDSVLGFGKGVDLVAFARQKQQTHGHTVEADSRYEKGELLQGALYMLTNDEKYWPAAWSHDYMISVWNKPLVEKWADAAALIAASIDVLHAASPVDAKVDLGQFARDVAFFWGPAKEKAPAEPFSFDLALESARRSTDPVPTENLTDYSRLDQDLDWFGGEGAQSLRENMMHFFGITDDQILLSWAKAFNEHVRAEKPYHMVSFWASHFLEWLKLNYRLGINPETLVFEQRPESSKIVPEQMWMNGSRITPNARKEILSDLVYFMSGVESEANRHKVMELFGIESEDVLNAWGAAFCRYLHNRHPNYVPALWSSVFFDWLSENYKADVDPYTIFPGALTEDGDRAIAEGYDGPMIRGHMDEDPQIQKLATIPPERDAEFFLWLHELTTLGYDLHPDLMIETDHSSYINSLFLLGYKPEVALSKYVAIRETLDTTHAEPQQGHGAGEDSTGVSDDLEAKYHIGIHSVSAARMDEIKEAQQGPDSEKAATGVPEELPGQDGLKTAPKTKKKKGATDGVDGPASDAEPK